MTRIRLFRRRFLSKSPALYYCYMPLLWVTECASVCLVHVLWKRFVCLALCLLHRLRARWASSHYRCVEKKGLNVVKFTESCFCLFIYTNIFLCFFVTLRRFFLFLPFEKIRKSCVWLSKLGSENWERNGPKRNLYQSMLLFIRMFFFGLFHLAGCFCMRETNQNQAEYNAYKNSQTDMTT